MTRKWKKRSNSYSTHAIIDHPFRGGLLFLVMLWKKNGSFINLSLLVKCFQPVLVFHQRPRTGQIIRAVNGRKIKLPLPVKGLFGQSTRIIRPDKIQVHLSGYYFFQTVFTIFFAINKIISVCPGSTAQCCY